MSAICIPLSVMFADILACRMILDLRERGYELTQPTVYAPGPGDGSNALPAGGSGTICNPVVSQNKMAGSPISLSQRSANHFGSTGKGTGLKSFLGAVLESHANGSQSDLERGQVDGSVELQSFTPQLDDHDDEKPEIADDVALPFGAAPAYHIVEMNVPGVPPSHGIRVDVEKTSM